MNTISTVISAIALQVLLTIPAFARTKVDVPYDELVAKADMVAIIEPIKNESAKDSYAGSLYGSAQKDFVATNTTFRVHAYLKGGDAAKEITILHFSYSKDVGQRSNGARFITFVTGPLRYEKRTLKDDKLVGGVGTFYNHQPVWLAFLKKRSDGRFDPISDPYDSADSFKEIHKSPLFFDP